MYNWSRSSLASVRQRVIAIWTCSANAETHQHTVAHTVAADTLASLVVLASTHSCRHCRLGAHVHVHVLYVE
jgi:hypothetical protein